MLRARTIRHSASAYFQRDYSTSPNFDLPTASWSPEFELEENRVRIQRPTQPPASGQPSEASPKQTRRVFKAFLSVLICCVLLWVFRNACRDFSMHVLDAYYNPRSFLYGSSDPDIDVSVEEHFDTRTRRWPPMVTKIPETRPDPSLLYAGLTPESVDAQFCNGAVPCRILLPLWIGEQESRGRMHLSQVLDLARALNRTLVLPNVGKSRIGACGRWEFDVYYDVGSFVRKGSIEEKDRTRVRKVMLMDDFKTWLEMRPVRPSGQVVFVDEAMVSDEDTSGDLAPAKLFSGDGLLNVHVDSDALSLEDPRMKKVRCLGSKFRQLDLKQFSAVTAHIPFPERVKPLPDGDLLLRSLARPEITRTAVLHSSSPDLDAEADSMLRQPEVLILYWDIRHFPFGPGTVEAVTLGLVNTGLDYSARIHSLTHRLIDPYQPYVAVHWRMESIPASMLPDCAEALVDTLTTLLSDPTLGAEVKTVWFASDFPWPVSSSVSQEVPFIGEEAQPQDPEDQQQPQQNVMEITPSARRSNTFRNVSHEHVEAIGIVRAAFRTGGALEGLKLTGISEELDRVRKDMEQEGKLYVLEEDDEEGLLLEDPGVLGILDKIAAMRAALFVSGAKRCGRVSTFTRQITDYRTNVRGGDKRNVVEVFG
ncbi:hypothetical protein EIP91_006804 [Steccherinum ochraceum]|uniref:Uncharacterized protein n=1 Tax=Steccherinum ochraceum TaxID=92696 RepID=A0A4R0R7T8_9APHY|nr:hypothetical protein EIP91_006804 [Steccherinum ochraceum]